MLLTGGRPPAFWKGFWLVAWPLPLIIALCALEAPHLVHQLQVENQLAGGPGTVYLLTTDAKNSTVKVKLSNAIDGMHVVDGVKTWTTPDHRVFSTTASVLFEAKGSP